MAAAVYVGGVVFLRNVASAARGTVSARERIALFRTIGRRFLRTAAAALAVLIATGTDMASDGHYGDRLTQKLVVVGIAAALTAYHSFIQGPALSKLHVRERVHNALDEARAARRDLFRVPSLLHRPPEARRHGWPCRAFPAPSGQAPRLDAAKLRWPVSSGSPMQPASAHPASLSSLLLAPRSSGLR